MSFHIRMLPSLVLLALAPVAAAKDAPTNDPMAWAAEEEARPIRPGPDARLDWYLPAEANRPRWSDEDREENASPEGIRFRLWLRPDSEVSGTAFYDLVGRHDLARAWTRQVELRDRMRLGGSTLLVGAAGAGLVASSFASARGMAGVLGSVATWGVVDARPEPTTAEMASRVAALSMLVAGITLHVIAHELRLEPVDDVARLELAREYNRRFE